MNANTALIHTMVSKHNPIMKRLFLLIALLPFTAAWSQQKDYPIQAVPFTNVKLSDNFWLPRIKTNHTVYCNNSRLLRTM
jgi:hypothetical protein